MGPKQIEGNAPSEIGVADPQEAAPLTAAPTPAETPGSEPVRQLEHGAAVIIVADLEPTPGPATDPAPRGGEEGDATGEADDLQQQPKGEDPLAAIATRITHHQQSLRRSLRTSLMTCIRIGEALIEAKRLAGHGRWGPFLARCGIKQRTAEQYVQFARNRDLIGEDSHGRADLTVEEFRRLIAARARARANASDSKDGRVLDERADIEALPAPIRSDAPSVEADPGAEITPDPPGLDESAESAGVSEVDAKPPIAELVDGIPPASGPPQIPDEEWLASLPTRNRLTDPAQFDRDALLWRRAQPEIARIRGMIDPSPSEIKNSSGFKTARNRLSRRLLFGLGIEHPSEWGICTRCDGDLTDRPGSMPCSWCDGHGYLLTHEADSVEDEAEG